MSSSSVHLFVVARCFFLRRRHCLVIPFIFARVAAKYLCESHGMAPNLCELHVTFTHHHLSFGTSWKRAGGRPEGRYTEINYSSASWLDGVRQKSRRPAFQTVAAPQGKQVNEPHRLYLIDEEDFWRSLPPTTLARSVCLPLALLTYRLRWPLTYLITVHPRELWLFVCVDLRFS